MTLLFEGGYFPPPFVSACVLMTAHVVISETIIKANYINLAFKVLYTDVSTRIRWVYKTLSLSMKKLQII